MNIGSLFHTPLESQIPQWVKELKVKSPYMKKIRIDDKTWYPKWTSKERWAAQQALNCALEVLDEYDY